MGQGDTLFNAVIGAVVTMVTSFVGVSPIIGGGVAAYLEKGDKSASIRIGALSGAIVVIPFVLFGLLIFGGISAGGASPAFFLVILLFVVVLGAAYTVGLSALGGFIGWYIREETTIDDDLRDAL